MGIKSLYLGILLKRLWFCYIGRWSINSWTVLVVWYRLTEALRTSFLQKQPYLFNPEKLSYDTNLHTIFWSSITWSLLTWCEISFLTHFTNTHTHTHTHTHLHTRTHTYTHLHTHKHSHTNTHRTHIHTHARTYPYGNCIFTEVAFSKWTWFCSQQPGFPSWSAGPSRLVSNRISRHIFGYISDSKSKRG